MKIGLITTRKTLEENSRIEEEIKKLGHEYSLIDMLQFEYGITDGKLNVTGLQDMDFDILILRGIFNSIKSITAFVDSLRKKGIKVFDNNFLNDKYSINKISDSIKLAVNGIPVPNTYHLHSFDKFLPSAKELGYPVVCKLTRTGKGAGVYKFDKEADFATFVSELEERESEPQSFLLQEFINYKYDLRVLILGDRLFCMRRIPGPGEFRANFSLGGSVELFNLDDRGKKLAMDAIGAVGVKVGGVDLLITEDDKRYILEVNHTPGMIGMEKATGENITKYYVEYALANAR